MLCLTFTGLVRRIIFSFALATLLVGCSTSKQPEHTTHSQWPVPDNSLAATYLANCKADYDLTLTQVAQFNNLSRVYSNEALLAAVNDLHIILDRQMNRASLFANVHPDATLRASAEACEQNFVALISEISLSRPLYDRIAQVDTTKLNSLDARFVAHMLRDYRRAGVDKDAATRKKIKILNEEINLIGQTFDKNIREGARELILNSVEDLRGLPQDYILKHPPNAQGKIVLTTAYPDYVPFMQYAESDELRQKFYIIFRQQAYPENKKVLHDLLVKRYELAQLLGYSNFADYITEDKMIKSADNAQRFIEKVSTIASPRAQVEYMTLLKRLQKINPAATKVEDWQKMYLEEMVKKEDYQVNSQEVRQYFQYDKVRQGIFDLTQTMFGITIKPWQTTVWHESVKAYEIWDGKQIIGRFYLDMHPREGKYKHAAQFSIINGITGVQLPEAALVCNFPGGDGSAGLMEHADVETFLHEFGHLLHNIFAGNQRWIYFSGVKTEWDFVEAPSQMLEEWVWNPATLATFAHNQNGQIIPLSLVEKMIAARDFGRAMWAKHQLFYAALSLSIYHQNPASLKLDQRMAEIQAQYSPFGYVDDTYFYASFGHLNGYSAIYYTYMWSLVIAADMHSEFVKRGLLNSALAQHYRNTVLAPGGSKDAAELVTDFLGRPYSFDAFAKDLSER